MKKETVNTFNEGLNKDLNPIVTPNNVLTDSLNGTFITFNGDELSLQNDAGNTKIPVKWDERLSIEYVEGGSYNSGAVVKTTNDSDETVMFKSMKDHNTDFIWKEDGSINTDSWELFDPVVKLSKEFYPIGIKEYGGVLYIVSGKKGVNEDGTRNLELDEIEFGSYPSPSNSGYKTFHGEKPTELIYDENSQNILYKSFIINNDYFKTGRYITFNIIDDINLDVSNVQTDTDDTKLYIIKLYLQLDNGVIDLTDNVWTKFNYYKDQNPDDTATHWLLSPGFEYYCPYSYNGRLAVKTVMSEPTVELSKTSATENDSGLYSLSFDVNIEDTNALKVDKCVLKYWYKSGDPLYLEKFVGGANTELLEQGNNSFIIGSIPGNEEILYYEVMPYFKYKDTVLSWEDFPLEFQQLYMIRGTIMLADKFKGVGFSTGNYECVPDKGIRKVKELILEGNDGFLNPSNLEYISEEDKPYAFFLSGHNNSDFTSLGTYTIKNGYVDIENITQTAEEVSILDMEGETYINIIKPVLRDTLVEIFDASCSGNFLKLRFSAPLEMTDPRTLKNGTLSIFQDIRGSVSSLEYESEDGRNFNIKINAFENITLSFKHSGFGDFNYTIDKEVLDIDKVYEIGLAVNFETLVLEREYLRQTNHFKTTNLDKSISEIGLYIQDRFAVNNISDRYRIKPKESTVSYSLYEQKLTYSSISGTFHTIITDPNYAERWRNSSSATYNYKLTDDDGKVLKSNIADGEYVAITNTSSSANTIKNDYIKMGTGDLGYVLFKIESRLVITLSNYAPGGR